MERQLRVLILEDQPEDVELIIRALRKADFEPDWQVVSTEQAFLDALSSEWDVILADYDLSNFDAIQALTHLQGRELDIPFIIVTGAIEETAVLCLKKGATDYLLKDRLARLGGAVRSALQAKQLRREKREAQAVLVEREALYRLLFEKTPVGLGISDGDGKLLAFNEAMLLPGGYSRDDIEKIGHVGELYCTPEEQREVLTLARELGTLERYETRFKRKDGSCYEALLSLIPVTVSGQPCWLAMVEDVTSRSVVDDVLRDQEHRYRSLFGNMPVGIYRMTRSGEIIDANPALIELLGYPDRATLLATHVSLLVRDRDDQRAWQQMMQARGEVRNFESRLHRHDGQTVWVEDNSRSVRDRQGKVLFFEGALLNITERKEAELARHESERRRRHVEETLREAAAAINASLSLGEVLSQILEQLSRVIPHDSASVQRIEGDVLVIKAVRGFAAPEQLIDIRIPIDPKYPNAEIVNGQEAVALEDIVEVYPHFHAEADTYQTGMIRSWLGVPLVVNQETIGVVTLDRNDILPYTEEEIALAMAFANHAAIALENARLYESLENYSQSLEKLVEARTAVLQRTTEQVEGILFNSPDAILLLEADGRIEMGNPTVNELFGYQAAELYDQLPYRLVIPEGLGLFTEALETAVSQGDKMRFEVVAQRKDGTTFDADVALAPIKKDGIVVSVVCSLRDITPLKEVERMKDIFVSNVSHELRTPIATLRLNHYLLDRNPRKKDKYMVHLGQGIERLNVLIEDLLRLSRLDQGQGELNLTQIDLNEMAVKYVHDRSDFAASKGLTLRVETLAGLDPVPGDEGLLGQVLSILLTNAFNYTPAGGEVAILVRFRQANEKDWLGLCVRDTGPGIPEDELPHLFERFFRGNTGLESGAAGTGLGLSIAQEIVKRHGGRIEVTNLPERGSAFTVWLPASGPKVWPPAAGRSRRRRRKSG